MTLNFNIDQMHNSGRKARLLGMMTLVIILISSPLLLLSQAATIEGGVGAAKVIIGDFSSSTSSNNLPLSYPLREAAPAYYLRSDLRVLEKEDLRFSLGLQASFLADAIRSPFNRVALQEHRYLSFAIDPQATLVVGQAQFALGFFATHSSYVGSSRQIETTTPIPVPTAAETRWRRLNLGPSASAAFDFGGVSLVGRIQYHALEIYQGRLRVDINDASAGFATGNLLTATFGVSVPIMVNALNK